MKAGVVAVISILGIAWLGSTFLESHQTEILGAISAYVNQYPWLLSLALFLLSILLYQSGGNGGGTDASGLTAGRGSTAADRHVPGCQWPLLLPTYATIFAAIQFDSTGTTGIGRWVLNHSFMRPGMVATAVSLTAGFLLSRVVYGS